MTDVREPSQRAAPGELLVELGRELGDPFRALVAEIHAIDERHAEDDGAARLVELAYAVQNVLEPILALAAIEASTAADDRADVDVSSLLQTVTAAPDLTASFTVAARGELGATFADERRLTEGLALCLRLVAAMIGPAKEKVRLQVHREVHQSSDRIVIAVPIRDKKPMALALLRRAASSFGASVDVEGPALTLGFAAGERADVARPSAPPTPVLAFRRDELSEAAVRHDAERASIVLVVDNEPAARDYMRRILELEGFDVVTSTTLRDAYDAAHAHRPDVVVIDRLQLAMEAGDWIRRFKDDPALARVPLVLMQSEESESHGLVGVAESIRKPIDPGEVVATIGRLTGTGSPPVLVMRDAAYASTWERSLEGYPGRIVVASTAAEAERILDTVTPCALIVDICDDDAMVLLENVRRSERTERLPVIAVHGNLPTKTRVHLDALADRCFAYTELGRSSFKAALEEIDGDDHRSGLGAG